MKQSILIILLALAFTSCINDAYEDCPGYMRFNFLYDGTSEGYDSRLGNDVHLRVYQNNAFHSSYIVPYQDIKNGKEFKIRKDFEGEADIVAWAVPANEDFISDIPSLVEDLSMAGEALELEPIKTRNGEDDDEFDAHKSMGYLFLGTDTKLENNINSDTHYSIGMNNCIAEFTAAIHNVSDVYEPGQEDPVWLLIHGTKSKMDLHFNPMGEDAAVVADFVSKESQGGVIRTDRNGLLPSAEGQYIYVEIYRDTDYLGRIRTNLQANPGDVIHLDINTRTAVVTVNGWRVFEEAVEWI